MTGSDCRKSSLAGRFRDRIMTIPRPVPTQRQEETAESFFRAKDSMKYKAVIVSLESLSILDTLELRERLKEFSLFSAQINTSKQA